MKTVITISLVLFLPACLIAQLDDEFHGRQNATINFYGKVADQEGRPLPDAKVQIERVFGEWAIPPSIQLKTERFAVQSDDQGSFIVKGTAGHSLQILSIEKPGYELSKKVDLFFGYSATAAPFHPDANNPVVFKMWKKQGKEPLVGSAWHGKMASDGTTNYFDLLHGRQSADGGLEIVCTRTPLKSPPPGNAHFDYSLEVAVIGGGIQSTQDEFTYLAPESGYSTSYTVAQKADDPKWWGRVTQEFYIKTAEGHYGRLSVDWYAAQNAPNHFEWDCSINPSGSRNLER
jgi:hypothetical protein